MILNMQIHTRRALAVFASATILLGMGSWSNFAAVSATPVVGSSVATNATRMPGTSNWYEYVQGNLTWNEALNAAAARTFNGIPGHLITITSSAENDFALAVTSEQPAWIGAHDIGPRDGHQRNWVWATGPEEGDVFTTCDGFLGGHACVIPNGMYAHWGTESSDVQPDGFGSGPVGQGTAAYINWESPGAWDDIWTSQTYPAGYLVEYESDGSPMNVRPGVKSPTSAEVRWDAAVTNGSAITGYVLRVSRNNGVRWTETEIGAVTRVNVPGMTGPAQAAWVSVASVNAGGQSAFSEPVLVTTTGVKSSVRVSVVDGDGVPVIGGAITWAMSNGAASSSKTYGLTDDGVIDFPAAPAGAVDVTVTGALTESGATVSGVFHGYLGFSSTVLQLPDAPVASRSVTVELPNGLPVPGVTVGLNPSEGQYQDSDCLEWAIGDLSPEDYCLEDSYANPSKTGGFAFSKTVQGFTFSVPKVAQTLTDANGKVVLTGFTNGQPRVDVSYDDGVITQAKSVVLRDTDTVVQLDYMPWVEVSADSLAAGLGAAVTIPVSVATDNSEIATRSRLARANQGIKVTVLPPAGAGKGTCKAKLTAATNRAGEASLTVCATKSGVYRFKTEGAAAVDGVLLKVKGAAPMSPTAVTVRSLSVGTVKASWNPPTYGGGSIITNYVITATAKGKPTVTKTVAGTVKSISLTGLANATKYTVKIQAKTVKGLSDPVTLLVPVA